MREHTSSLIQSVAQDRFAKFRIVYEFEPISRTPATCTEQPSRYKSIRLETESRNIFIISNQMSVQHRLRKIHALALCKPHECDIIENSLLATKQAQDKKDSKQKTVEEKMLSLQYYLKR